MAGAFVDGYQGETMSGQPLTPYLKVASTAKHYALNNVEDTRHSGSSNTTDANIRDYYTAQFSSLVENAHVSGIMTSYNAVNGTPSPANTYTANELLQRTYGFGGYTTSDCGAVGDIYSLGQPRLGPARLDHQHHRRHHHVDEHGDRAADQRRRPARRPIALRAGTDLNCTGGRIHAGQHPGRDQRGHPVRRGHRQRPGAPVHDPDADRRVRPGGKVAYTKITKSVDPEPGAPGAGREGRRQRPRAAQERQRRGLRPPLLPATPSKLNKVVIVGNLANTVTLGGYSGDPALQVNAVQGITAAVKAANPAASVTFDACGTSTTATAPAACSARPRPTSRPPTW